MKTYRAWINQPSTLQPLYNLHGKFCIVNDSGDVTITIWFVDGPVHSMIVPRTCISRCYLSDAPSEHGIYL